MLRHGLGAAIAIVDPTPAQLERQLVHRLMPRFHQHEVRTHSSTAELAALAEDNGLDVLSVSAYAFQISHGTKEKLEEFLATKPFFGMHAMSGSAVQRDLAFMRGQLGRLNDGPLSSTSETTLTMLVRRSIAS